MERPLCVARPHEVVPVCFPTVVIAIYARDRGVLEGVRGGAVFAVLRLQRGGIDPDGPECVVMGSVRIISSHTSDENCMAAAILTQWRSDFCFGVSI